MYHFKTRAFKWQAVAEELNQPQRVETTIGIRFSVSEKKIVTIDVYLISLNYLFTVPSLAMPK